LAAAVNDDWLLPGQRHGRALDAVDQLAVLVNPDDRVLRFYRFLSPDGEGKALGKTGLEARSRLGERAKKIVQVNVSDAVGNKHGWTSYITAPSVVNHLKRFALFEATNPPRNPQTPVGGGEVVGGGSGQLN
jgi:hypothetical protein